MYTLVLRFKKRLFPLLMIGIGFPAALNAQSSPDTLVWLKDATEIGAQRYHLLKASKLESDAAIKNIAVAKYSRLPSIDATYQANLATANNLTGIFYPAGMLPMTGPPFPDNNYHPATGSAASVLLNWQAVTFGQRNAQIQVSAVEATVKSAQYQQELFEQKITVISTYLDVLLAYEVVGIQRRNITRVQANLKQSRVLAITGIKPGVDSALFLSELSKATIALLHAKTQLQNQQWTLAQLIVTNALPLPADTSLLNQLPSLTNVVNAMPVVHPAIVYAQRQMDWNASKETLLKKSYLPKLNVWATTFGRGTGFAANGSIKTTAGLGLSRYNYGAGVQILFPIMKYGEVSKQLQAQKALSAAAHERLAQSEAELQTQEHIAHTTFDNSLAVSTETVQQLKSGQYAFHAMQIRYNTGLVNFSDLIQAQYNLLSAELEVKKGYWGVWKALLLQAAVKGDEQIFLNAIKPLP
jgi:outer membrane protein